MQVPWLLAVWESYSFDNIVDSYHEITKGLAANFIYIRYFI